VRPVRAVLFDMGGVLVTSPFSGFARYEQLVGLPPGTIRKINATNPESNAWADYESGRIDRPAFQRRFEAEGQALGFAVDAAAVLASMRGTVVDAMVQGLARVHATHKTALLTNNLAPMDRTGPIARALLPHIDVVVESAVVGMRKPEVGFYLAACELLGVTPPDCVFLDDLGVNCKAARALGMHTIKVVEPLDALGELEALLARS
jgi:putative hydrolase of the HAD superfamily